MSLCDIIEKMDNIEKGRVNAYKGRIYADMRATFGNRPEGKTAKDRKGRQLYDMLIKDLIDGNPL